MKTVLKTDESGSYVIVADPTKRLSAHSKDGKLLFEGSIETLEQQQKVPWEVWEKVKPLLEQMSPPEPGKPQAQGEINQNG